jgi:hypothetical protein
LIANLERRNLMAINYEKAWNTLKGNMKLWIDGLKDNPHAECYKYILKTMYQIEDNSKISEPN